jgi:hypothetical protein
MTRFLALCSVLALGGCDSPTGRGPEIVPWLQGSWEYAATQTAPSLRMSGTLTIAQQAGDSISGSIEYIEVDAQGNGRARVNMFTGRVRNGRDVTIDAYVGNRTRTHLGTLEGDSIAGDFELPINDNQSYSGSFFARRQ